MTSAERIDLLDKTLNRITAAIGSADAKVAQVFAISTAMLGFEATIAVKIKPFLWYDYILVAISALPLLFCIFSLFMVLYPRLSGPSDSILYFNKIAMETYDNYKKKIVNLTNDNLFDDYARQCHRNAEIARNKFSWLRKANLSLFIATLPWLVVVLIGYADF